MGGCKSKSSTVKPSHLLSKDVNNVAKDAAEAHAHVSSETGAKDLTQLKDAQVSNLDELDHS